MLGVVILDGFRPNVLFEFGILVGLNKPIILLKDKDAIINIKTLFPEINERNCKEITGLTYKQFSKDLEYPKIDMGKSSCFSDMSTALTTYLWNVSKDKPDHVSKKLANKLDTLKDQINEEAKKLLLDQTLEKIPTAYQVKYQDILSRLLNIYVMPKPSESSIDEISKCIKELEFDLKKPLPSNFYILLGSLYSYLAERIDLNDIEKN